MTSAELDNLARIGKLKREPPSEDEIDGLLRSAKERLKDAVRADLSYSSRFDLAYNAAHAFSLAALRRSGYRSDNRYLVFQTLPHTTVCRLRSGAFWRRRTNAGISPSTKAIWKRTSGCSPS